MNKRARRRAPKQFKDKLKAENAPKNEAVRLKKMQKELLARKEEREKAAQAVNLEPDTQDVPDIQKEMDELNNVLNNLGHAATVNDEIEISEKKGKNRRIRISDDDVKRGNVQFSGEAAERALDTIEESLSAFKYLKGENGLERVPDNETRLKAATYITDKCIAGIKSREATALVKPGDIQTEAELRAKILKTGGIDIFRKIVRDEKTSGKANLIIDVETDLVQDSPIEEKATLPSGIPDSLKAKLMERFNENE